jgi:hypothetical protein
MTNRPARGRGSFAFDRLMFARSIGRAFGLGRIRRMSLWAKPVIGLWPTQGTEAPALGSRWGFWVSRRAGVIFWDRGACGGLGDGGRPGGWLGAGGGVPLAMHCPGHASNPSARPGWGDEGLREASLLGVGSAGAHPAGRVAWECRSLCAREGAVRTGPPWEAAGRRPGRGPTVSRRVAQRSGRRDPGSIPWVKTPHSVRTHPFEAR